MNGSHKSSGFSNFYYNYLYIRVLLQLLHSQACKKKRLQSPNGTFQECDSNKTTPVSVDKLYTNIDS